MTKCDKCKKSTAVMAFHCKCGGRFCIKHRYPETHCCTFDHKSEGKSNISANNPKIVAKKIEVV